MSIVPYHSGGLICTIHCELPVTTCIDGQEVELSKTHLLAASASFRKHGSRQVVCSRAGPTSLRCARCHQSMQAAG